MISDSIKGFLQIALFCIGFILIPTSFFFLMLNNATSSGHPIMAAVCFSMSIISFILCYFLRMTNEKQKKIDDAMKLALALFCFLPVLFFFF